MDIEVVHGGLHPSGFNPPRTPVVLVEPQLPSEPEAQLSSTSGCCAARGDVEWCQGAGAAFAAFSNGESGRCF